MTTNRIASGILSLILSALLGWSLFAGVGDFRTRVMLGCGVAFGILYTLFGRIPNWARKFGGGSITDDDDPANISPRVYLPILFCVILIATFVCAAAILLM
jgi:hypothetical protein